MRGIARSSRRSRRSCGGTGRSSSVLDVIGGMLTEINITSPTGVRQASLLDGVNVAAPILDCFQRLSKELRG